jgi:hypothetical protein
VYGSSVENDLAYEESLKERAVPPKLVYDFLYVDVNRIARLVAQLNQGGVVTETAREWSLGGEAGVKLSHFIPFAIKGIFGNKRSESYDPSWRLPVLFLDQMEAHIVSEPLHWGVGQIVTLTGSLSVSEYVFAGQMLKVPAVRDAILNPRSPTSVQLSQSEIESFANAAKVMPHMLQAAVSTDSLTSWSTLNDACTTASTGDLTLKCGSAIDGKWTLTGILDVKPDESKQSSNGTPVSGYSQEFRALGDAVRSAIGRPQDSYGITPLTIHRKVEVPDIGRSFSFFRA